jgi:hypothetical protein
VQRSRSGAGGAGGGGRGAMLDGAGRSLGVSWIHRLGGSRGCGSRARGRHPKELLELKLVAMSHMCNRRNCVFTSGTRE